MNLEEKFLAFAVAFEEVYAADDWSRIASHFTEDALYYYSDGSDPVSGRDAILDKLQNAVNDLDRKMDQRDLKFHDISVEGDTVVAEWSARFGKTGLPPLDVSGREVARFADGAIMELKSIIYEEGLVAFGAWMEAHGDRL